MYRPSIVARCASSGVPKAAPVAAAASPPRAFASQTLGNPKRLLEYYTLSKWCTRVTAIKNYKIKPKVNIVMRVIEAVPWSAVLVLTMMMLFFGIDVGAGIFWTADIAQESREKDNAEAKKRLEGKQWSMDQIKVFEDGGAPQPSWVNGGPRS